MSTLLTALQDGEKENSKPISFVDTIVKDDSTLVASCSADDYSLDSSVDAILDDALLALNSSLQHSPSVIDTSMAEATTPPKQSARSSDIEYTPRKRHAGEAKEGVRRCITCTTKKTTKWYRDPSVLESGVIFDHYEREIDQYICKNCYNVVYKLRREASAAAKLKN